MRKIMTFILFASLANNIACSSGFEKAVPKNLQDLAGPLDTAPKKDDPNLNKDSNTNKDTVADGKTAEDGKTKITPSVKDGDALANGGRPTITMPGPAANAPASGIKEQAEVLKMDQAMEKREADIAAGTIGRITPVNPATVAPNTNTNVPVVPPIAPTTTAPKSTETATTSETEGVQLNSGSSETSAKVAEQADVRKLDNEIASRIPLEWAFSELRVILPDTLLATQDKEKQVVIANNALMSNSTAMFRLAGEKSYMLCRAAATPGLAKGDTFSFVSATQTPWAKDKRATVALLTFENKSTQKGLKFSCLIFGSKTENDFKANMKDVVEFRNHMGLYN